MIRWLGSLSSHSFYAPVVRKIFHTGVTLLVKYTYLADGTKLSALDVDGEGLVYRGPFVYRQSSGGEGNSSLTFESAFRTHCRRSSMASARTPSATATR